MVTSVLRFPILNQNRRKYMQQIFRRIEFVQKSGEEMQHLYDKEFENQSGDVSKNTRLTSDNLICQKSLYENLVWNLEFHDDFVVIKGMVTSAVFVVFCMLFAMGFIVANLCICGLFQGSYCYPYCVIMHCCYWSFTISSFAISKKLRCS